MPLLRAVRSGIMRFYADKPFPMKVIAKYANETDPEVLDRSYEFFKKAGFRRELVTSEAGLQGVLDFLSESIPEAKIRQAVAILRRSYSAPGQRDKIIDLKMNPLFLAVARCLLPVAFP